MMPEDYVIIGSRVRRRRKELGLTQEQLAEMAAISTPFLGHIERGTRKCSVETLVHIAEALDVCICRLIPQTHTCTDGCDGFQLQQLNDAEERGNQPDMHVVY